MPRQEKNILINYFETFNTYGKSVLYSYINCFILVYNFRLIYIFFRFHNYLKSVARELRLYVVMGRAPYFSPILTQIGIFRQRLVKASKFELRETCQAI
jgi:hypothetical protein